MTSDSSESREEERRILQHALEGDPRLFGELLQQYKARLRRMLRLRMDRRLQGRVDPSDVIQDAYAEASQRLNDYMKQPEVPFYVWLRFLAVQRLAMIHRHHLGIQSRDAKREVPMYGGTPAATSAALAAQLIARQTSVFSAAVRADMRVRLQEALEEMDTLDREVLALRHFEQLSNLETAKVLGIKPTAACNRYVRALERLKEMLLILPGGLSEWCT